MPEVLTLGAISAATAPAATLTVIRQYKAKSPVTYTLLPVVAMGDTIGLCVFFVSVALAQLFASGDLLLTKIVLTKAGEIETQK